MVKISGLPKDSAPTANDYIPVLDADTGILKKVLLSDLFNIATVSASLMSNPYKFRAKQSVSQAIPHATTTKATFTSEDFDTSNNYNTSTSTFTAPVAGFYDVMALIKWASISGSGSGHMQVYKNGSAFIDVSDFNSAGYTVMFVNDQIQLAQGDTVNIYVYQGSGVTVNTQVDAINVSYFGMKLSSKT